MSDTRAAIRELRSLSEKRSLGTLTEAEAARWLALRRQLGLPLEAAPAVEQPTLEVSPPPTAPEPEATASPDVDLGVGAVPEPSPSAAETPLNGAPSAQEWNGPSLDRPSPPPGSAWAGPALDAPAWSEAAADRPTDPGLDGPPPVPFDEAPAAPRPHEGTELADFGGSPDERVPLATASDFVSYRREGSEAIELPAESATPPELEPQSLAQLATTTLSGTTQELEPESLAPPAPTLPAVEPEPPSLAELATTTLGQTAHEVLASAPGFSPQAPGATADVEAPEARGVDQDAPLVAELMASSEAGLGVYEGVVPEPPPAVDSAFAVQPPVEESASEGLGVYEGVVPEAPVELEAGAPELRATDEGAVAEPPLELGAIPVEPSAPEAVPLQTAPLQLGSPLDEGMETSSPPTPDVLPAEHLPAPVSTWAPGADEPPVLAADDFARSGDVLIGRGLDPWPEEPAPEVSPDDIVETVSDEDVVEELPTPTPLPLLVAPPPGSGGIRGFQFPRPPPGPVPTPPTPPAWQRTQPGVPAFAPSAHPPAPIPPAAVAPTSPAAPRKPPLAPTLPVPPPPPPPRAAPPVAATFPTPPPAPTPPSPVPASAAAPVTPRPLAPPKAPTPVPGRFESILAPPAPYTPRAPVLTAASSEEDEAVQPLLELVDEVEPPRPGPPVRSQPSLSPPQGTPAVFGPPMMLNPSFVEGDHRVVIHTLEGQVHRGTVHNLDLQEEALAVEQPDGRSVQLPTRRLKAVFFVLSPGEKPLAGRGERVQVTFRDGRQVVGYSDDHATGEPGFFVIPSDARTNTARVYVFRGGVQSITTG